MKKELTLPTILAVVLAAELAFVTYQNFQVTGAIRNLSNQLGTFQDLARKLGLG